MAQRKLRTSIPARGDVLMRVRDARTGEVIRRIRIRNKIVNLGFEAIVKLLATGDAGSTLTQLRPGTGTSAPSIADTDVIGPLRTTPSDPGTTFNLPITKVQNAPAGGPYELIVEATLPGGAPTDVFNGKTITEAGLITSGGSLFSRQVHPGVEKTPAIAIDYEWHIRFIPA